ncbi:hypothetical protein AB0M79_03285 [Polymorphospora sp. NPDC051019]|uniref:hypothetical protein n=1 Tax=Polymorphospora sp. NPDC051019 TaxID=3155725 RepID=UPI003443CC43
MDRAKLRGLATLVVPLLVAVVGVGPPAYAADPPGLSIRTKIVDGATAAPVRDICVFAVPVLTFRLPDTCPQRSDVVGQVTVTVPEPGSYNLFVLPDSGSRYGAQWVGPAGGTGAQQGARRITLAAGDAKSVPMIRLDRRAVISGRVGPAAGEGTVGIVGPDPYGRVDPRYAPIAADGTFRIDWLGPYGWPLLFRTDHRPYQWSGNVGNRLLADLVPATVGEPVPGYHHLDQGALVTVSVPEPPPVGGRLVIRNAVTQDPIGVADRVSPWAFAPVMEILGGQQVKIQCLCGDTVRWHGGTDFASATPVVIRTHQPTLVVLADPPAVS